ncbi:hypothetical protein VIGAN_08118500, partial [Vigna angularis var. angularis]
ITSLSPHVTLPSPTFFLSSLMEIFFSFLSLLRVRLIRKPFFLFSFEATHESGCDLGANNVAVADEGSDDALQGVSTTAVERIVVPIL